MLGRRQESGRFIERVAFEGEPGEQIPALLMIPRGRSLPLPAVVYLHSQGPDKGKGKSEALRSDSAAAELCHRGCVVLAPEIIGYEERRQPTEELEAGRLLLQGWSLPGKTAWEMSRAVDYLSARPEVESNRIGLLGMHKGAMLGWLAGAVEPRFSTLALCFGTSTYAALLAEQAPLGAMGWVPGLLNWGDVPEVCSLLAPRPLFFCAAEQDPLFPFRGYQEVHWRVRQLYLRLGADEKLDQHICPGKPHADKEVRARLTNWFDRWL